MIKDINPVQVAEKWQQELKLAKKEDEKWCKRGKKIIRRYRDERTGYSDTAKRFNVLWSNVQTLLPATYANPPKAEVERRWKDQDPIGRTAAQILERALQYEIDTEKDYDAAIRQSLMDRLLPGRGTAWVRFETKERMTAQGPMQYECSPVDYVYWEDFRCQPARTWDEVTWVARRVYMNKADLVERFGEEFADVPMTHEPIGLDEMQKNGENVDSLRKAQVWEIWDKSSKRVCWVAEGYQKALDCVDDPYGLDSFWPCPKPLFATQSTDTLVPVPDFALYQDQADEIDLLTQRINMLVKALKIVGVYDSSQTGVQRMLSEGVDNTLIPVDTWAAFSEKGGIKGVIDFLPLDNVIQALNQCYNSRQQALQVVYEVTGLSDIIRGSTVASETATAQQIKSQFASLRLRTLQRDVAVFASELLRIKAQLMCDLYSPQTLVEISGIMATSDAQFAEQAMMLLKSEPARGYRVDVAADSLVELDEAQEKQDRIEFLNSTGGFLQQALPIAQQVPQMAPLLAEMLLFGVRAFKGGRPLEAAFDGAMAQLSQPQQPEQPQGPSPEEMAMQAQQQAEQAKMQAEMQAEQARLQLEQAKLQAQMQLEQFKAEQAQQIEMMRQQAETQRAEMKARIDAETKIAIAQMTTKASEKPAVSVEIAGEDRLREVGDEVKLMADMNTTAISQAVQMLAEAVTRMNRPKRRLLERGPDGRAAGVVEIEIEEQD